MATRPAPDGVQAFRVILQPRSTARPAGWARPAFASADHPGRSQAFDPTGTTDDADAGVVPVRVE